MSIFFCAVNRVNGAVSPLVARYFAERLDAVAVRVIRSAIESWKRDNWFRFDDDEVNCSVRIYNFALLANNNAFLHIQLESVELTHDVLSGLAAAKSVRRPDLRFVVGQRSYIVECKRLSLGHGFPGLYVTEGIERFRLGLYGTTESRGAMMGFIQGDQALDIVTAVNDVITNRPGMGSTHVLLAVVAPPANPCTYESDHVRPAMPPVHLDHFLVDIQ